MVVRQHLINHGCTIPLDVVREALEAAEAVWPHDPPARDPASTTSLVTDRSWTAPRQPPGTSFGFSQGAML